MKNVLKCEYQNEKSGDIEGKKMKKLTGQDGSRKEQKHMGT